MTAKNQVAKLLRVGWSQRRVARETALMATAPTLEIEAASMKLRLFGLAERRVVETVTNCGAALADSPFDGERHHAPDAIAYFELRSPRLDRDDLSCKVDADAFRKQLSRDQAQFACANDRVDRIHARRIHLHQYVTGFRLRTFHVSYLQHAWRPVTIVLDRAHQRSFARGSGARMRVRFARAIHGRRSLHLPFAHERNPSPQ